MLQSEKREMISRKFEISIPKKIRDFDVGDKILLSQLDWFH